MSDDTPVAMPVAQLPLEFPPIVSLSPPPLPWQIPPHPRLWTVFVLFAILLVAMIGTSVVGIAVFLAVNSSGDLGSSPQESISRALESPTFNFIIMAMTTTVALAAAVIPALLSPTPWRQRLQLVKPAIGIGAMILLMFATLALGFFLDIAASLLHVRDTGTMHHLDNLLSNLTPAQLPLAILIVGLMAGTGEELFFRGYAQSRLRERMRPAFAILISAVLFAILHMDPVQSTLVLFLGAFFGWVTEKSKSTVPAIVCHVWNNACAVIAAWLFAGSDQSSEVPLKAGLLYLGASAALFLILTATASWLIRRRQLQAQT